MLFPKLSYAISQIVYLILS